VICDAFISKEEPEEEREAREEDREINEFPQFHFVPECAFV